MSGRANATCDVPLGPEAFKPRMSPTSLSILLPNFSNSPRYKGVTSAPSATSAELEKLTEIGIDLYNNRKFAELAQSGLIFIEAIKVNQDGNVKKADFNGHMQYHQAVLKENPTHKSRIVECATDVDDRKGEGTVFALLEVTGYPSTLCRQMISVVKWKRNVESGKWQIANVSNMRGAQGFA
ncbi:hypothetical protein HII31_07171 [Pseudocercospora fuligena]|uniref:Uncharacterized protein n=1 Tax=Pseudocercospora fuligena TaxID=685502 RepID=A0A8H6VKR7_9PEZI|nr:hypothetical protein HII31_07171 [Pseudocercospora fuligena]